MRIEEHAAGTADAMSVSTAQVRRRSAIVVAHPDDEILWLSSVIGTASRVVLCFGDVLGAEEVSAARRRAVDAVRLPGLVDLGVPESGAGFSVDWQNARRTHAGVAICDSDGRLRYEANYQALVEALRPTLVGFEDVYTHNPWGEYGHAEHIQVYRAVSALQAELGFTLSFSNYISADIVTLAKRFGAEPCWTERRVLQTDRARAHQLMRVYQQFGAWTWTRFHQWPLHETLYAQPPAGNPMTRHGLTGERLFDVARLRWLASELRSPFIILDEM